MSFLRRFSLSSNDEKSDIKDESNSTKSPATTTFLSGTAKLFDSVNAKTSSLAGGFTGGFTSKFDQLKRFASQDSNPEKSDLTADPSVINANNESGIGSTPTPINTDQTNGNQPPPSEIEQTTAALLSEHTTEPRNTNPFASDIAPTQPCSTITSNTQHTATPLPGSNATVTGPVFNTSSKPKPPKPPPPRMSRQNTNPFVSNAPPKSMRENAFLERHNSVDSTNPLANVLSEGNGGLSVQSGSSGSGVDVSELTRRECEKIVNQMGQWMSMEDAPERDDEQEFVQKFVKKLLRGVHMTQDEKAKFGEYCQKHSYRKWFGRVLENQNLGTSPINEAIFYTLVQFFAVVLFECHEAKDYEPARDLMNLSFVIYAEVQRNPVYLYNFLKDQPVWQTPKFWESALLSSIQEERLKQTKAGNINREAIPYNQIKLYLEHIKAFGINKVMSHDFLRKQTILLSMSEDEILKLRQVIDSD